MRVKQALSAIWTSGYSPYGLLLTLSIMVFVTPYAIETGVFSTIPLEIFVSTILMIGVFSVPCGSIIRSIALTIVILSIGARFLQRGVQRDDLGYLEIFLSISMIALYAYLVIRQFFSETSSVKHRIAGAVTLYLMLGILWARLYELVLLNDPHAFNFDVYNGFSSLIYFSFVTLLTIGYGDIYPVSIIARNLAICEGGIGQLFIVIIISSLVSERVTKELKN